MSIIRFQRHLQSKRLEAILLLLCMQVIPKWPCCPSNRTTDHPKRTTTHTSKRALLAHLAKRQADSCKKPSPVPRKSAPALQVQDGKLMPRLTSLMLAHAVKAKVQAKLRDLPRTPALLLWHFGQAPLVSTTPALFTTDNHLHSKGVVILGTPTKSSPIGTKAQRTC